MRASMLLALPAFLSMGCVGDSSAPGPDASTDATLEGAVDAPANDARVDAANDAPSNGEAGGPTMVLTNAIYRGILTNGSTYADHLYTAIESELSSLGYQEDTPHPFFYFAANAGPGGVLHELDRCSNSSLSPVRHTLGIDKNCGESGYVVDGPLGFVATDLQTSSRCGATQFVKLYRAQVQDHVFTNIQAEITSLEGGGYVDDASFVAYAWTSPTIICYP